MIFFLQIIKYVYLLKKQRGHGTHQRVPLYTPIEHCLCDIFLAIIYKANKEIKI